MKKTIMRISIWAFLVCCFACSQQGNQASVEEAKVETEASVNYDTFGEKINDADAVSTAQFVGSFSGDQKTVKLTGVATAVCKKKGCWMNIAVDGDQTMTVKFKDYGFFVPTDIEGKTVVFEGAAKKEVTDVATLQHFAEDAGKSPEEIAAITEPKEEITFEATGVLVSID